MANFTLEDNSGDDTLDIRDIIERFEELETALLDRMNEQFADDNDDTQQTDIESDLAQEWLKQVRADDEEATEYNTLKALLAKLCGNGGDEQWQDNWYPATLLRDNYFEEAMGDMVADCYELDALKLPSFITLEINYSDLRMDYSEVELNGVTYLYR